MTLFNSKYNSLNNKNFSNKGENKPQTWEEIEKAKWKDLTFNNPIVTDLINNARFSYTKSPKILALEGIYKRSKSYYKNPTGSDPPKHDKSF